MPYNNNQDKGISLKHFLKEEKIMIRLFFVMIFYPVILLGKLLLVILQMIGVGGILNRLFGKK